MSRVVLLQVPGLPELLPANVTRVPLVGLCVDVLHVRGQPGRHLATDRAHLLRAHSLVLLLDVTLHPEKVLVADRALLGDVVLVNVQVLAQVPRVVERLPAHVTDVRLLPLLHGHVRLHVQLQVVHGRRHLAALGTLDGIRWVPFGPCGCRSRFQLPGHRQGQWLGQVVWMRLLVELDVVVGGVWPELLIAAEDVPGLFVDGLEVVVEGWVRGQTLLAQVTDEQVHPRHLLFQAGLYRVSGRRWDREEALGGSGRGCWWWLLRRRRRSVLGFLDNKRLCVHSHFILRVVVQPMFPVTRVIIVILHCYLFRDVLLHLITFGGTGKDQWLLVGEELLELQLGGRYLLSQPTHLIEQFYTGQTGRGGEKVLVLQLEGQGIEVLVEIALT